MGTYDKTTDYTSAAALRRRSPLSAGVFRCQRCDRVFPDNLLVEQDGNNICRTYCADAVAPSQIDLAVAELLAVADSWETNALPLTNILADVPTVTAWSVTRPISIARGATQAVTFTGVNFTAANFTVTYDDANITTSVGPTLTGSTQADVTISVGASTPVGPHTITICGDGYFGAIKVY